MANVKISNLSTTWTSSLAEHTAIRMDVTDSASSGSSKLIDLLLGGASKFSVRKDSVVSATSFIGGHTGSLLGTASLATTSSFSQQSSNSTTSSYALSVTTASYSTNSGQSLTTLSASQASYSNSSSYSQQSSNSVTSSHSLTGISSSYAFSSGQSSTSLSASQSTWSLTASFALNGGGSSLQSGSSYNITSSWAVSASYAANSSGGGGTTLGSGSSYNITSSWANTASLALNLPTGSLFNITASRSITSSYTVSSSYSVTASYIVSASYANTASYAERYAPYWPNNVEITGSGLVPNDNSTVWYVTTTGSFTLIASALGSQPQYYKWYINSSSLIQSGSSNSLLKTSATKISSSGYYTCQVTNSYGSSTSRNFLVQVLDPAIITSETIPGATPPENSLVSFQLSVTGDNVGTRWKKRSSSIPNISTYVVDGTPSILNVGHDTTNLTIQAINPESEGTYFCEVSNSISYVTSSNMLIYVTAPTIVTQPADLNSAGVTSIVATGSAISYSWEYNGLPITGQTDSTLNLDTAVQGGYVTQTMLDQGGTFKCKVYNGIGYVRSNAFNIKPFKKSGTSVTGVGSSYRAYSSLVVADCSNQIIAPVESVYNWYRNGSPVGADLGAFGQTLPTLTLDNVQSSDAGTYECHCTYNGLTVVSDGVSFTVLANDNSHTGCPAAISLFSDETYTLNADYVHNFIAFGGTPVPPGGYRIDTAWRSPSYGSASYGQVTDSQTVSCMGSYTFPDIKSYGVGSHAVLGSTITGDSQVWKYQLVYSNYNASCPTTSSTVSPIGDPYPYISLVGAGSQPFGPPTQSISVTFSDVYTATLTKLTLPSISVQPVSVQSASLGGSVSISVTAAGSNLQYRWYKNGVLRPDYNTNVYSISSAGMEDTGSYYCKVGNKSSNSYRTVTSNTSVLYVS